MIKRSLSCLSPNGLAIHSLEADDDLRIVRIITNFLPIDKDDDNKDTCYRQNDDAIEKSNDSDRVKKVETVLPNRIVASLKIDPAIELLCVDNNLSAPSPHAGSNQRRRLPLLALYSASSLWVISITFSNTSPLSSSNKPMILNQSGTVPGKIFFIREPFEETLLTCNHSTRIIRVRAPPSSLHAPRILQAGSNNSSAHTMICPSGSMAMMTSEGFLILNHSRSTRSDAKQNFRNPVSRTRYGFDEDSDDDDFDEKHETQFNESLNIPSFYTTSPLFSSLGGDTDTDPITDFCFGDSPNDLFTIYILKKSGDIYAANPLLFDGTAVPRHILKERLNRLDFEVKAIQDSFKVENPNNSDLVPESRIPSEEDERNLNISLLVRSTSYKDAQIRRIKTEKQFLIDSFQDVMDKGNGYYVSSSIHGNATLWPVQLQGPLLYGRTTICRNDIGDSTELPCTPAMAVQSKNSVNMNKENSNITFIVVGRINGQVDLCALSRPVEGRFGFESGADGSVLDNRIIGRGVILETVCFNNKNSDDDQNNQTNKNISHLSSIESSLRLGRKSHTMLSLVVDSVMSSRKENLIHYISNTGVFTIASSLNETLLQRIKAIHDDKEKFPNSVKNGKKKTDTTAWSCLTMGSDASLNGAVVSGDPSLGHILIAHISNGSMEVVNLTAAQYLHHAANAPPVAATIQPKDKIETIDSIPPFTQTIIPLIQKIQQSFSSTGKLIGSTTYPKDAGPTNAALMLTITKKLQTEIVIPLSQIHDDTQSHKKMLLLMYQSQMKELQTLKTMMEKVKGNHENSVSKLKALKKNANEISQRSAAILDASRSMHPKVSQAEHEYFTQLKRWEIQTNKWTERLENIQNRVKGYKEGDSDLPKCFLNLSEEQIQMCGALLRGQGVLLKSSKETLIQIENGTRKMLEKNGLVMDNNNFVKNNQF